MAADFCDQPLAVKNSMNISDQLRRNSFTSLPQKLAKNFKNIRKVPTRF